MNIQEHIQQQQAAGFDFNEIKRNLLMSGYEVHEVNAAMQEYGDKKEAAFKTKYPILNHKLTPIVLLVLDYLFFFHILPIDIAEEFSIFFALLGGVITLILFFWFFAKVLPSLMEKFPIASSLISVFSLFAFAIGFIFMTSNFSSSELKQYGVVTKARVVDMTKIYGKRGKSISSIKVEFVTENNTSAVASIDISENEYDMLEEGMEIPIRYSSKHTNIARIEYINSYKK